MEIVTILLLDRTVLRIQSFQVVLFKNDKNIWDLIRINLYFIILRHNDTENEDINIILYRPFIAEYYHIIVYNLCTMVIKVINYTQGEDISNKLANYNVRINPEVEP